MKSSGSCIGREIEDLKSGLNELGVSYDDAILGKFRRYLEILYEYENRLHLISHRDYTRISRRHFLTALCALSYIKNPQHACDLGAGAGFPSIPIKILYPGMPLTLFESKKKKARFLEGLVTGLALAEIKIIDTRAESLTATGFDLILIKAAGRIKKLLKTIDLISVPLVRVIFFKSSDYEDEIKAAHRDIRKRGFNLQIENLKTPIEHRPLTLIILEKPPEATTY
jgi:16S rRNA (guanine527-N7)-methyltransferase